jgi:SAM-dependent methyltransferase
MSLLYRSLKAGWRSVVPHSMSNYFFGGTTAASRAILSIKSRIETRARRDEIYDAAYYENYTEEMDRSAVVIADSIIQTFHPQSIIDIGCGFGEVLSQFVQRDIDARGADLSVAAIERCKSKGLTVRRLDLEDRTDIPDWKADVVISTEVAEHIPAELADHFVHVLTTLASRVIVMTGAPPSQGGTDHVNEQPYSYWIEKFGRAGFPYSTDLTDNLRNLWRSKGVEPTRAQNVMVFSIHY